MVALLSVTAVVSLVAGFGLGRIKDHAKLAAIAAEVKAVEGKISADFAAVVAKIRAKL